MIHPAVENDSPYFGKIVEQRIKEYQMFTDNKTKDIIKNYWAKTTKTKIIYNSVKNKNLKKLLFWGPLKGKINKIIGKK